MMGIYLNCRMHQLSDGQRRAEKSQGELAHSLDPTDNHRGFYSGRNLQTESKLIFRKGRLINMMGNSDVTDNHS